MLIIGERINTSRKQIEPAVVKKDAVFIQEVARKQKEAGADFIDVNCGTLVEEEPAGLAWLVQTVQAGVDTALSLDSPNPAALRKALEVHKGKPIVNSISLEKQRYSQILPLLQEYKPAVVALAMGDEGLPNSVNERYENGSRLVEGLTSAGIPPSDIYLDPLVRPVSTDSQAGVVLLETIRRFRETWPEVHIVCGLSNISYGMPVRRLINQSFLVLALQAGLDAAILDPMDQQLMGLLYATRFLLGKDEYGVDYLKAFRSGRFE